MNFEGARVLVTGAASGLGEALASRFRAAGADVLATDLHADEDRGIHPLDVTADADWAAAVDHVRSTWGGLEVLVNNAGVAGGGRVDRCTIDEWQWITEINLYGAVRGTFAFTPLFKEQRNGAFVNVASLAALVHPAGMASYNAVKAAVLAFTETTGHELAAYGITAHAICPSYFRTNIIESLRGSDEALAEVMRRLVTESPTSADDIAREVLAALERGDELILPDEAARAAYALKVTDRPAYDAVMRRQAAKLHQAAGA